MRQQWFTHVRLLIAHPPRYSETSTAALTTPALDRRSLRWFGISACTATPEDLPPSLAQHGSCRRSSTSSSSLPFRTHVGAGNSAVVVDLPRCGPMLSPLVPKSCTDSWHHWLGSLRAQAAPRTSRSSSCATNSLCCADRSTDPNSPTPTAACSERLRPRSRDRAEPGGWSPPTRCCVGTGAASSGTGPNHIDRRADRRPQQRFADSHCASQPRIRPGATAASTANSPGSATA